MPGLQEGEAVALKEEDIRPAQRETTLSVHRIRRQRERSIIRSMNAKKEKAQRNPHDPWILTQKRALARVNALRNEFRKMSDEELMKTTEALRKMKNRKEVQARAFAAAREATRRETGMEHYDVQILGAIALSKGKIAELKTGEGKTILAVMAAYLESLKGNGVHVVTVNEYLAERDGALAERILARLGVKVGTVTSESSRAQKQKAYGCDVTYVTNSEVAFDYLRDNMVKHPESRVLRGLASCIIDEVDSVLIDEAKTPLIIAGEGTSVSKLCRSACRCAEALERGHVYSIEMAVFERWLRKKAKREKTDVKAFVKKLGGRRKALEAYARTQKNCDGEFSKAESILGFERVELGDFIADEKTRTVALTARGTRKVEKTFAIASLADSPNIRHAIDTALRAHYLMKRDRDYIVSKGEVLVVDEYTGRALRGRQYADGLHQAIEAKERLEVQEDFQTVASIAYQSFFAKYGHLSGMTGTAYTQRKEFRNTYGLDVVRIPTNRPMIRKDHPDRVYLTAREKSEAVADEIRETVKKGQPVLVGTTSVRESERLSELLKKKGIAHQVLNARQDRDEAEIIARAGVHGTVTVATNMAGRGTDIVPDEEAKKAGGLKVIGTQRHESQRIDNQLRGRSGRQGDAGESVFYVSLEDDIVKRYMNASASIRLMKEAGHEEGKAVDLKTYAGLIRNAQMKAEDDGYEARKSLLRYDSVDDAQRERYYRERKAVLEGEDIENTVEGLFERASKSLAKAVRKSYHSESEADELKNALGITIGDAKRKKKALAEDILASLRNGYGENGTSGSAARKTVLAAMDEGWTQELRALEYLKDGMHYVQFGQRDDASIYAIQASSLHEDMQDAVALASSVRLAGKDIALDEAIAALYPDES